MSATKAATGTRFSMVFAACIAVFVGVVIASPSSDFLTLLIQFAVALLPLLLLLTASMRIQRKRGVPRSIAGALGCGLGIGVSAAFLSVAVLRLFSDSLS